MNLEAEREMATKSHKRDKKKISRGQEASADRHLSVETV